MSDHQILEEVMQNNQESTQSDKSNQDQDKPEITKSFNKDFDKLLNQQQQFLDQQLLPQQQTQQLHSQQQTQNLTIHDKNISHRNLHDIQLNLVSQIIQKLNQNLQISIELGKLGQSITPQLLKYQFQRNNFLADKFQKYYQFIETISQKQQQFIQNQLLLQTQQIPHQQLQQQKYCINNNPQYQMLYNNMLQQMNFNHPQQVQFNNLDCISKKIIKQNNINGNKNTKCKHFKRRYYAKNMCNPCYQRQKRHSLIKSFENKTSKSSRKSSTNNSEDNKSQQNRIQELLDADQNKKTDKNQVEKTPIERANNDEIRYSS